MFVKVLMVSNVVTVEANSPMQGHLALTNDPTQMRYAEREKNSEEHRNTEKQKRRGQKGKGSIIEEGREEEKRSRSFC